MRLCIAVALVALFTCARATAIAGGSSSASPSPTPSPQSVQSPDLSAESAPTSTIRTVSIQATYIGATYGPGNVRFSQLIPRLATFRLGKSVLRLTLPRLQTINGLDSGYGDMQMFYLFESRVQGGHLYTGVFAQLPTASPSRFGTGKWLLGPAAAYVATFKPPGKIAGVLVQTAFSVAGPRTQPNQSALTVLPFATWRIGGGWFLKWPEAPWVFDLQHGATVIPVGLGIGRAVNFYGTPLLVAISDDTSVVHANIVNAPKNTLRLYFTLIVR